MEDRGREDRHAALLARRQQGVERALVEQRVAGGEHHDVGVRLAHQRRQLGRVEHPRADRAHHALRPQLRECRVAVPERGVEVRLGVVEEERVEAVDAHAVERVLDAAADAVAREVPHAAVCRGDRKGRVVVHPAARVLRDEQPPDLGRERVVVPRLLGQERSHQALRLPEPVVRRGVEGADPGVPRRLQRLRGGGVVQWLEQATERAAAEAEPRHSGASSRVSSPRVSPTRSRHLAHREQRARDVGLGGSARVVADGEALVGRAEDDLGRHDEARQPDRVDLRARHVGAARLARAVELVDRHADRGPPDLAQPLGELARRAARDVGLAGARVVDDLPLRQVARRQQRGGLAHRGGQGEVPRGHHADRALARGGLDLLKSSAVRPELPITTCTPAAIAASVLALTAVAEV